MAASRAAIGTELVTTTSSRSAGSRAAIRAVVVPASSSTLAPPSGKNSVAAAAMASLCSARVVSRSPTPGSTRCSARTGHGAAVHPPQHPALSRTARSRRTVSVVTS